VPDPDPYQNVTDPEHWVGLVVKVVLVVGRASGGGGGGGGTGGWYQLHFMLFGSW
jgi:hypothetical protein